MHIAHFTNTYKPNINGVVRSISTFRDALSRLGHQVFIFAQDAPDYEDTEPFVFRYPAVNIPKFDYSLSIPASLRIDWLMPSLKLDVIHSNHPVLLGAVAVDKAEKLDLPLVFTFHTRYAEYSHYIPFSQAFIRGIIVDWLANYMEQCHHIVTPSDSIRQILVEHAGITERVTTIPTGIDLSPFQQADGQIIRKRHNWGDNKVLISIGRMAPEKNWKTLLSATNQIMDKYQDIRLVLIGDGPQLDDLKKFAKEQGIAERVLFTGLVPFDEIPLYLKAADLFCFASVSETQGLVTMEAMAAGLPVVAINATGTRDVIQNGQEGLLTENDATALAQSIQRVLEDGALFGRLKAATLKKARSFDIMIQASRMMDVYEQAIEDKNNNQNIYINRELLNETKSELGLP